MKKGILILAGIFALSLFSCKKNAADQVSEEKVAEAAERDAKQGDFPVMEFAETEHDFGNINEGDVVEHTFKFTNTGKTPLVVPYPLTADHRNEPLCTSHSHLPNW